MKNMNVVEKPIMLDEPKGFMALMQDSHHALELLSGCGFHDNHSLCDCCIHRGLQKVELTCPPDGGRKFGHCPNYTLDPSKSEQDLSAHVLAVVQTPIPAS